MRAIDKLMAKAAKARTKEAQVKSYAYLVLHVYNCGEANPYCNDLNVIESIVLNAFDGFTSDAHFHAYHNELISHVFNNHASDKQYFMSH